MTVSSLLEPSYNVERLTQICDCWLKSQINLLLFCSPSPEPCTFSPIFRVAGAALIVPCRGSISLEAYEEPFLCSSAHGAEDTDFEVPQEREDPHADLNALSPQYMFRAASMSFKVWKVGAHYASAPMTWSSCPCFHHFWSPLTSPLWTQPGSSTHN